MAYEDSDNKRAIRRVYDFWLLKNWQSKNGNKPLTYFGLPGPEIHDLLDWRELLDKRRTGVESFGRHKQGASEASETIGRLKRNLLVNGPKVSSGFELLIADIEDVILDGMDAYGKQPCMSDKGAAQHAKFTYDLVNLDFNSGLGYSNKQQLPKRVEALKELFKRQQGHSFVFFLTISVRHTLGGEFDQYLSNLRSRDRGSGWTEAIDWFLLRGKGQLDYKLKATVPSFIQAVSEPRMFRSYCLPPISYVGHEKAHLVHFAFIMESTSGTLRAFSVQDDRSLIDLPLLICDQGRLSVAPEQHPGFDKAKCNDVLSFLPDNIRISIIG